MLTRNIKQINARFSSVLCRHNTWSTSFSSGKQYVSARFVPSNNSIPFRSLTVKINKNIAKNDKDQTILNSLSSSIKGKLKPTIKEGISMTNKHNILTKQIVPRLTNNNDALSIHGKVANTVQNDSAVDTLKPIAPLGKETWPSRRDANTGKLVRYKRAEYIAELVAAGKPSIIPVEFRFLDDSQFPLPVPVEEPAQKRSNKKNKQAIGIKTFNADPTLADSVTVNMLPSKSTAEVKIEEIITPTIQQHPAVETPLTSPPTSATTAPTSNNPLADLLSTLIAEEEQAHRAMQTSININNKQLEIAVPTPESIALEAKQQYDLAQSRLQLKNMKFSYPKQRFVDVETGFEATADDLNAQHYKAYLLKKEADKALGIVNEVEKSRQEIHEEFRAKKRAERKRGLDGNLVTHALYRDEQNYVKKTLKPDRHLLFPDRYRRGLFRFAEWEQYDQFALLLKGMTERYHVVRQSGEVLSEYVTKPLVDGMSEWHFILFVDSLGKLGFLQKDYPEVVGFVLQRLVTLKEPISFKEGAQCLRGLQGMRVHLNPEALPEGVTRDKFLSTLFAVLPPHSVVEESKDDTKKEGDDNREVELLESEERERKSALNVLELLDFLRGMNSLNIAWKDLPADSQKAVMDIVLQCAGNRKPNLVADIMNQLVLLQFTAQTAPQETQVELISATLQALYRVSVKKQHGAQVPQMSRLLEALAFFGADYSNLTQAGLEIVDTTLLSILQMDTNEAQKLSVLKTLNGLKVKWPKLSSDLQTAILSAMPPFVATLQANSVFNAVHCLGFLETPFEELPAQFTTSLTAYFAAREVNKDNKYSPLTQWEVKSYLYNLMNMQCKWDKLPVSVRKGLVRDLVAAGPMPNYILNFVCQALAQLDCQLGDKANSVVRQKIISDLGVKNLFASSEQLFHTVSSLGKLRLQWSVLPAVNLESELVRLKEHFDFVGVSLFLKGMAGTDAQWTNLSVETVQSLQWLVEQHAPKMNQKALAQTMSALILLDKGVEYSKTFHSITAALINNNSNSNVDQYHNSLIAIHRTLFAAHDRVTSRGDDTVGDFRGYEQQSQNYFAHLEGIKVDENTTLREGLRSSVARSNDATETHENSGIL